MNTLQGKLQEVDEERKEKWSKIVKSKDEAKQTTLVVILEQGVHCDDIDIMAQRPLEEPIHISDTEQPEDETCVEDFQPTTYTKKEHTPEKLVITGNEEVLTEDIIEGDLDDEEKENEEVTATTKIIQEEKTTQVASTQIRGNLRIFGTSHRYCYTRED